MLITDNLDNGIGLTSRRVPVQEYMPMMSEYLLSGRRQEVWHINWIEWDGLVLRASARLDGWQSSGTDAGRFHLSIFSARELDAQLGMIGIHLRLGLSEKSAEVWLLECTEKCEAAITDAADVRFEMQFHFRRSKNGKVLARRDSRISGTQGGMIHISALVLMHWDDAWGSVPDGF